MPELKNTFTGGRMEKDLDERVVPNGLYREALNIEVSTSEGSDVGAAQNILGNIQVTEALKGPFFGGSGQTKYQGNNRHIAHIVDPETDMLYRFVATESPDSGVWVDRIVEYDTTKKLSDTWDVKEKAVMIDIWKVRTKCVGFYTECGVTHLKVRQNFGQIRPYMVLLYDDEMRENCRIMTVEWGIDGTGPYADIRLNLDITGEAWFNNDWCGADIYFAMDRILNFHPDRKITGINILDGMLFWTDNYSEPKKVNIERGKLGSHYELKPIGSATLLNYTYEDFDKHTKLVVNVDKATGIGEIPQECVMLDEECPIPGCIDPNAINYNPLATVNDESCIQCTYGCTDSSSGAKFPDINGYDRDAIYDCNISTTVPTSGTLCPYQCNNGYLASNYDPCATCAADITCVAAGNNECCCYNIGCTDPLYCNYDQSACYDDNSCSGLYGCTDPIADNYQFPDPPNCDDGSCIYKWKCIETGWGINNCNDNTNYAGIVAGNEHNGNPNNWPYGWIHQMLSGLQNNNTSAGLAQLLSTGCATGLCTGVWFETEEDWCSGAGCLNNTLGDPDYFATQVNPNASSTFKCIHPSTGDPATMDAGDKWLISHNITQLVFTKFLPEDPASPPVAGFAYGSTHPVISETNVILGQGGPLSWSSSVLGTANYGIGFTQNEQNWSWAPNNYGYPDIVTICRFIGFDGTNPWSATFDVSFTSTSGNLTYNAGDPMPEITPSTPVQDVIDLLTYAEWTATGGDIARTWTQPSWVNGVYDSIGGPTNTFTWNYGLGIHFSGIETWFGFCECDNWGACECVIHPDGIHASKNDCETYGNSSNNCCNTSLGPSK